MAFSESTLHEIRNRIDLIDLVSERVSLQKAGRNFKGLCPFHQEKTASFTVSPDKQIFYCFGCQEGGDLFRFISKIESLTFPEAVEWLAEKAGVALESASHSFGPSRDEKEICFQANQLASDFYHQMLKKMPPTGKARLYLQQRGVDAKEIEKFRLGYAPASGELIQFYRSAGFSIEAAVKAGVLKEGSFGIYEAFKDRLIFPIVNRDGRSVGLGGRILEDQADAAKYINSADSPIYDKRAHLYGLFFAKEAIRRIHQVFVVEGYFDLIALHQFGFENAVAPLGTALTREQIRLLKRYAEEIILLFDADPAGWKAAERALPLFIEEGLSAKVLLLPPGEDPDTFIRKYGSQAFEEKKREIRNLFSVVIDKVSNGAADDSSGKMRVLNQLKPYFSKMLSGFEKHLYARQLAQTLRVPENWVFQELGMEATTKNLKKSQVLSSVEKSPDARMRKTEERLLQICMQSLKIRHWTVDKLKPSDFIHSDIQLLSNFIWENKDLSDFSVVYESAGLEELQGLLSRLQLEGNSAVESCEEVVQMAEAQGCVRQIQIYHLKKKSGDLSSQIRQAELTGQNDLASELMRQQMQIAQELSQRVNG